MFVFYSPLIMALIVNKTKLVGTTTVASNDCIALLRNLKANKTFLEFHYFIPGKLHIG